MCKLLLEQKYDGVNHVNQLGGIEYPGQVESSEGIGIIGIVYWFTFPTVVTAHIETKPSKELKC